MDKAVRDGHLTAIAVGITLLKILPYFLTISQSQNFKAKDLSVTKMTKYDKTFLDYNRSSFLKKSISFMSFPEIVVPARSEI